jgi:hypothetical protein
LEGVVPRYAISMWNSFDRLNSDIPRTNNSLEAWHNAFQKTVDCHRPSLVKLLDKFQLEQNQSENFMLRYRAGFLSNESSKSKYFQLKKRLQTIARGYTLRCIKDYLANIALNVSI